MHRVICVYLLVQTLSESVYRIWIINIIIIVDYLFCWFVDVGNNRLKHRGPDWSGLHQHGDCYLAHQRLAIVDPASGDQPLFNEDKSVIVTVGPYDNIAILHINFINYAFFTFYCFMQLCYC